MTNDDIDLLIAARDAARKARDFAAADAIRERLFAVRVVAGPLIYRISIEDGAVSEWHWTARSADSTHNED